MIILKKIYISFVTFVMLGISAGIFYLTVIRPDNVEIPKDIVMDTAFGGQYHFNNMSKKVRLIEFMYTNCPDVCPTTSLKMNQLRNRLESEDVFGNKVEFLTITIDPKRDSKEKLQLYAKRFDIKDDNLGWYFLRGTESDTKKIAESFRFIYSDPGTGYLVHSTFTYLLDENNKEIEVFSMGEEFNTDKVYKRIMNEIN